MIYSSAKDWWFYWFYIPLAYGAPLLCVYLLLKTVVLPSGLLAKKPATKKIPFEIRLFSFGFILLVLLGFTVLRNYGNYLYGIELTPSGVYWRDWDKGHLMKWNQVSSIEIYTNIKGRPAAIITAKNGQSLKADSLAFAHWDSFVGAVATHSGRPIHDTGSQFK